MNLDRDDIALILHDVNCPDGERCDATPTAMGHYYRMADAIISWLSGKNDRVEAP